MKLEVGMRVTVRPDILPNQTAPKNSSCSMNMRLYARRGKQCTVTDVGTQRDICYVKFDDESERKSDLYWHEWFMPVMDVPELPVPNLFRTIYQPREKGKFAPPRCGAGE